MATLRSFFGVTANRADDSFGWAGPAPMAIPLDVDTPTTTRLSLLIPTDAQALDSFTRSTEVTAVDVTATGARLRMDFLLFLTTGASIGSRWRIRVPWEVGTIPAGAGARGRIVVNLMRRQVDGSVVALRGVSAYNGTIRAIDTALTHFNEDNMVVQLPEGADFREGEDLVLRVEFAVTTTSLAGSPTILIFHDPRVDSDSLVVEADWPR